MTPTHNGNESVRRDDGPATPHNEIFVESLRSCARVEEQRQRMIEDLGSVLDGELLVYDESMTPKGLYDELGTRSGIAAFGTNFWVRQTADGKPSGYSREDARRHYLVKVFDVLRCGNTSETLPKRFRDTSETLPRHLRRYNGEEILRRLAEIQSDPVRNQSDLANRYGPNPG